MRRLTKKERKADNLVAKMKAKYLKARKFTRDLAEGYVGNEDNEEYMDRYYEEQLIEKAKKLLADNVNLEEEQLDEMLMELRVNRWSVGKVTSVRTLKFTLGNVKEDGDKLTLALEAGRHICLQESNMSLKLGVNGYLSDVFVIRLKHDKSDSESELLATKLIKEGVYIGGVRYSPLLITAAQSRTGHLYICPFSKRWEYRKALCNGVDFRGTKGNLGKRETRVSLGLSSGYILGKRDNQGNIVSYFDFTVKYVPDVVRTLDMILAQPDEKQDGTTKEWIVSNVKILAYKKIVQEYKDGKIDKEEYDALMENFETEVTDGMGLVDVRAAAKISHNLGLITQNEFFYFMDNFKGFNLAEVSKDKALKAILSRIPTAFQVRHQFDKGLVVIWDLQAEGIEEDMLMPKSMHKLKDEATTDSCWRICGYNKKKGSLNKLSYQSLQKLNLPFELMIKLGEETMDFYSDVLVNVNSAIEFCNMHDNNENDDTVVNSILDYLRANPECICSEYIQSKLLDLMRKQIHQTLIGRVVIPGAYYYMICDPRVFFNRDTLKSGENYLNGDEAEYVGVRYPCVSFLEPQKLNFVNDKGLWFLKDLVVFNPIDGRWKGMGGADFDGDICLIIKDQRIIDEVNVYPHIVDIKTHSAVEEKEENFENAMDMYLDCYNGSEVGIYSNNSCKYISKMQHLAYGKEDEGSIGPMLQDTCLWTFFIGKEIDRAKTKEKFVMSKRLVDTVKDFKPDWMVANGMLKQCRAKEDYDFNFDKMIADDKKVIKSNCTMGRYFRYMKDKYGLLTGKASTWKENLGNPDEEKFLAMLEKSISIKGISEMAEDIKGLYKAYTDHMVALAQMRFEENEEDDCTSDESSDTLTRDTMYKEVIDMYKRAFLILCRDKGYNMYTATYLAARIPYAIDKANVGRVYTKTFIDKYGNEYVTEYAHNKKSKSFAFNVAGDFIYRMLTTAATGKLLVKIPDTERKVVDISKGYLLLDGFAYSMKRKDGTTRVADGRYDVVNNRRGSFIEVEEGFDVNERLVLREEEARQMNNDGKTLNGFAQSKDVEDKFRFTLCNTKKFNTTPKEVIETIKGSEIIVDRDKDNEKYFVITTLVDSEYKVISSVTGIVPQLVGKKFKVAEDVEKYINFYNTYASDKARYYSNKKVVREAVDFECEYVGELSEVERKLMEYVEDTTPKYEDDIDVEFDNDTDYDYNDYGQDYSYDEDEFEDYSYDSESDYDYSYDEGEFC